MENNWLQHTHTTFDPLVIIILQLLNEILLAPSPNAYIWVLALVEVDITVGGSCFKMSKLYKDYLYTRPLSDKDLSLTKGESIWGPIMK
jgi:hypothetical protein